MSSKDAVEFCAAGQAMDMQSDFADVLAASGGGRQHPQNFSRDLLRTARRELGVNFSCYCPNVILRDPVRATVEKPVATLLPYEVAHLLWEYNRDRFYSLIGKHKLESYWRRTIDRNEIWFQQHPMRQAILDAEDRTMYFPIHLFGDDGTLRKSRAFQTVTWFSALPTTLTALHCRIPCYLVPNHLIVRHVTEARLQKVIAWSLGVWLTGRFPRCDDVGTQWPPATVRAKLASEDTLIAGGHIAVFAGAVCDHLWMQQHFRYAKVSSPNSSCHVCSAQDAPGPLNYLRFTECPLRSHGEYMRSQAAADSPLSSIPGFHISMTRAEPMHAGPLGAMADAVGSSTIELCDSASWGFEGLTPWKFRMDAQLSAAHMEFCHWAKTNSQEHTVKKFTSAGFSMQTLGGSWPFYNGKAHNCLAICRWLACKCREGMSFSEYAHLRAQVMWAWAQIFEIMTTSVDPDWLNTEELARLDAASNLMLHGMKVLGRKNAEVSRPRWKCRPKLHSMWHVNQTAQAGHRNPRAYWSFKDEEAMGKLGQIAANVHAQTVPARSLEHWCMQFFNAMSPWI